MFQSKSWSLVALLAALAWSGCAEARNLLGVTAGDETTYVASVEVVQKDTKAPAGFADALRDVLLKEAAFYGEAGRPIALKIELDRVHFKNAAAAMLIGDDNRTEGHVSVVDPAAGQQMGDFDVEVDAEKPGDLAGEIALDVVGAFDPTGAVDIAHMAGSAGSADIDRAGTTAAMITNFANETLRQTFGDARAKAAHARSQVH